MNILIYDVHASESGALAILNDLYIQIRQLENKNIKWIFAVSTPEYEETENIKILRYPWVKKSWLHRLYFDLVITRNLLKKYNPDKIYSLQNTGILFYKKIQCVYFHLASILPNYRFRIKRDGLKMWVYQNILSKWIFFSLQNVDRIVVQTQWMKKALSKKANISSSQILVIPPDVTTNKIGKFEDTVNNRKRFFYPATSLAYKNHIAILKACDYIQKKGFRDYEIIFTINPFENKITQRLYDFALKYKLPVVFHGSMAREEVFQLYTQSVLLFPSLLESFGLPLLEARMSGTFIIASNCPFSREILRGYGNAMFFKSNNYRALGDYMLEVANKTLVCDNPYIQTESFSTLDGIISLGKKTMEEKK